MIHSEVGSDKLLKPIIGTFEGKCADSIENKNEMLLSKDLWVKLFNSKEYLDNLDNGFYIGFLGHPEDPGCQEFEKACIIMREGHIDDDGQVYGKFDLVDTPVGRIVKAFIDAGVKFGISVRGAGDVGPDGYVDPDTFVFRGFDLVAFPAYDDAIPEFTQIAASSDASHSKTYRSVVKSISENISSVTSSESLNIIKSQFNPKSDQYKLIEAQQCMLSSTLDISDEKIKGLINLYADSVKCTEQLASRNSAIELKLHDLESANNRLRREISSVRRILSNNISLYNKNMRKIKSTSEMYRNANSKLKQELGEVKSENLNYLKKIDSSSAEKHNKDKLISSLKVKLDKTFDQIEKQKIYSSDLESKISKLNDALSESNKLIAEYQDAYASIYANAIGVRLDSVSVTSSTSVEALKDIISNGASSTNIQASYETIDGVELMEDYSDIDNGGIVVL